MLVLGFLIFISVTKSTSIQALDEYILSMIANVNEYDYLLLGQYSKNFIQLQAVSKQFSKSLRFTDMKSLTQQARINELNKIAKTKDKEIHLNFEKNHLHDIKTELFWITYVLCKATNELKFFDIWLQPKYDESTNTITSRFSIFWGYNFQIWITDFDKDKPTLNIPWPLPQQLHDIFKKFDILHNPIWYGIEISESKYRVHAIKSKKDILLSNNRVKLNIREGWFQSDFIAPQMHVYKFLHIQSDQLHTIGRINLHNIIIGDASNIVEQPDHEWFGKHKFALKMECHRETIRIVLPKLFNGNKFTELHLFEGSSIKPTVMTMDIDYMNFCLSTYMFMYFNIDDGIVKVYDLFSNNDAPEKQWMLE